MSSKSLINCNDNCRRIFWICIIVAFIFIIIGSVYFINIKPSLFFTSSSLIFLYGLWILNMFMLIIFTYYSLLSHPHCTWLIFLLFIIALLFATCWALQFNNNLMYANFSIIIVLVFSLAIIYFPPARFQFLGILYLLAWLYIFFYINLNKLI